MLVVRLVGANAPFGVCTEDSVFAGVAVEEIGEV
jgi:hypothetical protein